jgi:nicotinamide-nucleotide amidase
VEEPVETQVGQLLRRRGLKLALAESCTGGLIGHRLTNVPGSSEYYLGGVIAYANEVKERLLGVRRETLAAHGAVSRETALEMARGIRRALAVDFPLEKTIGLSTTGVAGPGGGLPGKPVGLVWIGLSASEGDWAWRFLWGGSRLENKEHSAQAALRILGDYLHGNLPPEEGNCLQERTNRSRPW